MKYILIALLLSSCKLYDYHVIIDDNGTLIYNRKNKFVNFLPFDSTSKWDQIMLKDNL